MPPGTLTDDAVRALVPESKPRKYTVGSGLYLLLNPDGSRYWRFRYRFHRRQNTVSCGVFPAVGVFDAILRRDHFRRILASGFDPSESIKAERRGPSNVADARFSISNGGALTIRLLGRWLDLTAEETAELRTFLIATQSLQGAP